MAGRYEIQSRQEILNLKEWCSWVLREYRTEEDYQNFLDWKIKLQIEEMKRVEGLRAPVPPEPSFIYLMRDERTKLHKIGISKSPSNRERTLQSQNPMLSLVWKRAGTRTEELQLHSRFSHKRVRGEWFDLNEEEILEVMAS